MQDTLNRAEQLANLLGGAMPELTRAEQLARIERVLRREDDRRKAARAEAAERRGLRTDVPKPRPVPELREFNGARWVGQFNDGWGSGR